MIWLPPPNVCIYWIPATAFGGAPTNGGAFAGMTSS